MKEQQSPYLMMEEEDATDIKQTLKKYLHYWPWFVLGLLISLVVSYFNIRYTTKVYETSAKIKILAPNKGTDLSTQSLSFFFPASINLENEIEIISSYGILEKVVEKLDLTAVFFLEGEVQTTQLDTLPFAFQRIQYPDGQLPTGNYIINVTKEGFEVFDKNSETTTLFPNYDSYLIDHGLPFQIKIEDGSQIEKYLGNQFNLSLISKRSAVLSLKSSLIFEVIGKRSDLIKISMSGQSVSRSEKIINTLIETFNEDGINDRQLVSKNTIKFLDERFFLLSQELDSIESYKTRFKQSNNLVYIEADAEMSLMNRENSENEVFNIENQIALSEMLSKALEDSSNKKGLLPQKIGIENINVNSLIEEYNAVILERDNLTRSGGINNPAIQKLTSNLNELRLNINTSISDYKKQLAGSKKTLIARNNKFSSEVFQLPEKEKLLRDIDRQQEIKENLYLFFLKQREEAAINIAVTQPSLKVVEYALSDSGSISPNPKMVYIGSIALGLMIPFGVLFIMFSLDTKIHDKKDIEKLISDIPVVGEIPKIKEGTNTVFSNPNDRSILAESFRILSSNTNYILPIREDGSGSVIYTTSTIKGEGKTFTSINLSLALSSLNKKVLLIGADLRNPQLHNYLNIDKKQSGLSNYLHDIDYHWKENLIKGFKEHPRHDTLLSGEIPPNPPHLLSNGRFEALLEEARTLYDYIIVDTAPTISVTDTLLISELADATVYICRANYTEKILLEHSNALAHNKKLKNMAYVINQVGVNKKSSYGYNYGYGYGYNEDTFKRSWKDKLFNR